MAKKSITNQSIFVHYKSEENMVTAALLHILKLGGEELINFILDARTQTLPSSEIAVLSQVKGNGSVPDALLTANYSFKLIIESKITTGHLIRPAIVNDTVDKNGRRCAFIRRQTYTTLAKIEQAEFTSQLR